MVTGPVILASKLREIVLHGMGTEYYIGSSSLHSLQTALHISNTEVFDERGIDSETKQYKINVMQLMH